MPGWIGPWEIAILLVVALLVFGPKRLPEMGRSLGKGLREFKDSVSGAGRDDDGDRRQQLQATAEDATPAPAPPPDRD